MSNWLPVFRAEHASVRVGNQTASLQTRRNSVSAKENQTNKRRAVMRFGQVFLFIAAMLLLVSCGTKEQSKFRSYRGPAVTAIIVDKSDRQMFLLHNSKVLETFTVHLGGNPVGHKQFEGDGKTPEGVYFISHHNPRSPTFHQGPCQ